MNINNPTLSADAEAGFRRTDDHVLSDSTITQDHVPTGNGSNLSSPQNSHEVTPANGENDPIDDRPFPYVQIRAPLSEKRKKNFTICWCSFVMLNLVFLVVVALKLPMYPVIPVGEIYLTIPIFEPKSVKYTQEKNETVNLAITFINPNPLASYSYDEILKININYSLPRSKEHIYFARIISQGADQFKIRHGKVNVTMLASGLPGLLQQNKDFTNLVFCVFFKYSASCRRVCNTKPPYYGEACIDYTPDYWPNI